MQCERTQLDGDPAELARQLRALVPTGESVAEAVREIIARVKDGGDAALAEYTRRFDTDGAEPRPLRVSDAELDRACEQLDPEVREGLEIAIENAEQVAGEVAELREDVSAERGAHVVSVRWVPLERAGIYVPGGRAPYPSTVVMGVVPARVACVPDIAVCSPPGPDGEIDPTVLAACRLAGASAVYRMGGAQAIAALAYGTESVAPVDVIVGPGNLYVQEAKRQVSDRVAIDGFAGPSDLMVIAGGEADPELVALDLLAQAEHGPGTLVVGVSDSPELLEALETRLRGGDETGAVARLVEVQDADQAIELAEAFAPEHLQLVGEEEESRVPRVRRAGCVFVGPGSGTAFGDYIAGSNHILPTSGAARFTSGLTPDTFMRSVTEVWIDDGSRLARAAAPLARAEGFELHARSMEARIRDNQAR